MDKIIDPQKRKVIEEAVLKAESSTSAEIVPVIIGRSSTVDHVFPLIFLFLIAALFVSPLWSYFDEFWGGAYFERALAMAATLLVSYGLSKLSFIRRWCLTKRDMEKQVELRAIAEFSGRVAGRTKDKTGLIVVLSLLEKRSFLFAEEGINKHFPEGTWDAVLRGLSEKAHKEGIELAFAHTLNELSDMLAVHLPIQADDTNEISNKLVLLKD